MFSFEIKVVEFTIIEKKRWGRVIVAAVGVVGFEIAALLRKQLRRRIGDEAAILKAWIDEI